MREKVRVKLVGVNGNVFALAGKVANALRKAGRHDEIREFHIRLPLCRSYDEALALVTDYVEVVSG